MKRLFLLLILLAPNILLHAQSLVANGNFEERNVCTEFNVTCAPEAWFFIPAYVKSAFKEDNNHVEVLLRGSANSVSNFIYTKLLCQLRQGEEYTFSIWIKSNSEFDSLNVWMGTFEPGLNSIEITESTFTLTKANIDSTKGKWKKYNYTFTAVGEERFLMIGNLNVELTYKPPRRMNASVKGPMKDPFYYIDNISLFNANKPQTKCDEYFAIKNQVYEQNRRHPAAFIESVDIDKSLITNVDQPKKTISWVIVDTPPSNITIADTLIIPDILFKFNSSELEKAFSSKLDSLLSKIANRNYSEIEIVGHTDNEGSNVYNQKLSLDRAVAIKAYIDRKKWNLTKNINVKGEGEKLPRSTNSTKAGRQQNRRVEIILKK